MAEQEQFDRLLSELLSENGDIRKKAEVGDILFKFLRTISVGMMSFCTNPFCLLEVCCVATSTPKVSRHLYFYFTWVSTITQFYIVVSIIHTHSINYSSSSTSSRDVAVGSIVNVILNVTNSSSSPD